MTTEQLNQARATVWHQAGNPLLTADDAAAWLRETGVSLFLPRTHQLATPAPSFVEAVLGASEATPSREAIDNANRLLERLLATGDAIALNLLGTPGEQPDFLATVETLPFLVTLIGDKEWKRGPRGKSSPLVIEVWKLLDREGPLNTIEVKEKLGRQLTEAAALRALTELWSHLRIEPVLKEGESTTWQLLERSRQQQMQAGSTMSQAVALSALVSLYLQSSVAASGDEIEVFLSPFASRSKVREAVRGLTATRQLSTLNLGPIEMYHVEGSLPEFAEVAGADGLVVEAVSDGDEAEIGEGRRRFVAQRLAAEADAAAPAERAAKPASYRGKLPGSEGRSSAGRAKPEAGADQPKTDRRPFAPRPGTTGGERRPYGTRAPGGVGSFNPREPWKEDRKSPAPPAESAERRPFAKNGDGASGERKPFTPREGGERKSFTPRTGDRSFKPRSDAKPFGERKSFGERKPFTPREGQERKPFTPREGGAGERKPFTPRTGERPFKPRFDADKPRSGAKPFGERKSFGDRKPFAPRSGGDRKPFTPREGGERKPYMPREGSAGERKPFSPRGEGSAFKPRSGAKPFGKSFGGGKPFAPREGGERKPFTPREGGASERKSFAPRSADRPYKSRPDARPFTPREGSDRKPFSPRAGGERKPYSPREGGGDERKPFSPRGGDRAFKPRSDAKPFGERKSFGERKPYSPREGGERKPLTPRAGGAKPFKPGGDRSSKPRFDAERSSTGRPERPASPRPSFGVGRPASPGARKTTGVRKTTGATRARTTPTTSSGKPRSGVRPPLGRPGPRATRGGAAGAPGRVKRTPRPGKGRSK